MKNLLITTAFLVITAPVLGHGSRVTWEMRGDSVLISAAFDDGQPMDRAQVTVFSGAAPSMPYIAGWTDENGEFSFLPDKEESLNWDVRVRKAGHGDILHLSFAEVSATGDEPGRFTTIQIVLMSACVVWGLIGTSFFFTSRRNRSDAHT